jgi:hypothetical protein
MEGGVYEFDEEAAASASTNSANTGVPKNGFGFSTAEITRLAHRELRLQKAIQYKNQQAKRTTGHQGGPVRTPKAA